MNTQKLVHLGCICRCGPPELARLWLRRINRCRPSLCSVSLFARMMNREGEKPTFFLLHTPYLPVYYNDGMEESKGILQRLMMAVFLGFCTVGSSMTHSLRSLVHLRCAHHRDLPELARLRLCQVNCCHPSPCSASLFALRFGMGTNGEMSTLVKDPNLRWTKFF